MQITNQSQYYYIKSALAHLHQEIDSKELTGRVAMGEEAEITKSLLVKSIQKGSTQWFLVKTPDGREGYVSEDNVVERRTPYIANLLVNGPKATIYIKYSEDEEKTFYQPDILVHGGTRLLGLDVKDSLSQEVEFLDGMRQVQKSYFWVEVSLPDGSTRYIKSTKVILNEK